MRLGPRGQLGCGVVFISLAAIVLVLWLSEMTDIPFRDAGPFFNLLAILAVFAVGCMMVWSYVDFSRRKRAATDLNKAAIRQIEGMVDPSPRSSEGQPPPLDSDHDAGKKT